MHLRINAHKLVDHTKQSLLNKPVFFTTDTAQRQWWHAVSSTLLYFEGLLVVVDSHIEACLMQCYSIVSSTVMMVKGHSISLISGALYHWQQSSGLNCFCCWMNAEEKLMEPSEDTERKISELTGWRHGHKCFFHCRFFTMLLFSKAKIFGSEGIFNS